MNTRISTLAASALCGLALCLLTARGAAAQGQAKVIAQARIVDGRLFAFVDDERSARLDPEATRAAAQEMAGSTWTFRENQEVTVSQNGRPLVSGWFMANETATGYLLHRRAGENSIDGWITLDPNNSRQAGAILVISRTAADGSSVTMHVFAQMSFEELGKRPQRHARGAGTSSPG
jgi:hypothetical protein